MPIYKPHHSQALTLAANVAAHSNTVLSVTRYVRLVTPGSAFVSFGVNTVANTAHMFIPPNWPQVFAVSNGERISAVQLGANTTLYITELTQ